MNLEFKLLDVDNPDHKEEIENFLELRKRVFEDPNRHLLHATPLHKETDDHTRFMIVKNDGIVVGGIRLAFDHSDAKLSIDDRFGANILQERFPDIWKIRAHKIMQMSSIALEREMPAFTVVKLLDRVLDYAKENKVDILIATPELGHVNALALYCQKRDLVLTNRGEASYMGVDDSPLKKNIVAILLSPDLHLKQYLHPVVLR